MHTEIIEKTKEYLQAHPDTDLILANAPIDWSLYFQVSKILQGRPNDNCTMFLTTDGGNPDAAYRISRCLRHHYKHVRLVIPSRCKSAGTLISICADEIAIGDMGELGPLDVQVRDSGELYDMNSGLDYLQAMQAVNKHIHTAFIEMLDVLKRNGGIATKIAGEIATKFSEGISQPLYAQIDPTKLGQLHRKIQIATAYGTRLSQYANNLKDGALHRLIGDYPSHSFVIDRKEAGDLFNRVTHLTVEEVDIFEKCYNFLLSGGHQFGALVFSLGDINEQSDHQANVASFAEAYNAADQHP